MSLKIFDLIKQDREFPMCATLRVCSTLNLGRLLSRIIGQNVTPPELGVPVCAYKYAPDYNVMERKAATL